MSALEGWILDANVDGSENALSIWVKRKPDGRVVRVLSDWKPWFYVCPRNGSWDVERLIHAISQHPHVSEAVVAEKYVSLEDREKSCVVQVTVDGVNSFKKTIRDVEKLGGIEFFNTDIPLEQMFFFSTQLFPFAHVSLSVSTGQRLEDFKLLDSRMTVEYETPALRKLEIVLDGAGSLVLSPIEPIRRITLKIGDQGRIDQCVLEGKCEAELLRELSQSVNNLDPDVIMSREGDAKVFPYLQARVIANQLENEFTLSRDGAPLYPSRYRPSKGGTSYFSYGKMYYKPTSKLILHGRLHIDEATTFLFEEGGLEGLIEEARLSLMPVQQISRATVGYMVTSMQNYQAWLDDVLIPAVKRNTEGFKTGTELIRQDRGGFVFEPKMGVHEDVGECDYFMMYPSIMHHFNISPETVNCKCCEGVGAKVPGVDLHICRERVGLVPRVVSILLEKRRECKRLLKEAEGGRKERLMSLQTTVKWGGVVSFGYLGFKGYRFGRIDAHIAVTAFARELLLRSAAIAQRKGFDLIHGIVDSLWVKKNSGAADAGEYKELCKEISEATELQLDFKGIYKWIVFLNSTTDPDLPVLNRYYGLLNDGEMRVRGLEVRKHDTPPLIHNAQMDMVKAVSGASNSEEFIMAIPKARRVLNDYVEKVLRGDADPLDLVITRNLSRSPSEYSVVTRQAAAAEQLRSFGVNLQAGQRAKFIVVSSAARNPVRRVLAAELLKPGSRISYDKSEYVKLLQRAFDSLFPPSIFCSSRL
ncbi:MAG: DNA polymerase domain-containing protein [Promethearchaeati archaeon SRVP18_Atabeyarchaeia-1]